DLAQYGVKVLFPASGGPGPKALALKAWLKNSKPTTAENKLSYIPALENHDALPPDKRPALRSTVPEA
ncbi:hypothetical protein MUO69_01560, partial [Candidatus Bathyarchaeota archaeon]|nr:hypothetical protein [Candidatus Bathyarchaeota archaeon]